jgi:hypothetical protein
MSGKTCLDLIVFSYTDIGLFRVMTILPSWFINVWASLIIYYRQFNNFKMMGGNSSSGQMGVTNNASMMQMQMQRNPMDYASMINGREEMN